jgi:hypothetical protein
LGLRRRFSKLCETEVEDLYSIVLRDEKILRFEIAMSDPALVSRRESADDLLCVVDSFSKRYRTVIQTIAQFFADEQLADDERHALVLADVVDSENVRMIESGRRSRLLLETSQAILGRRQPQPGAL